VVGGFRKCVGEWNYFLFGAWGSGFVVVAVLRRGFGAPPRAVVRRMMSSPSNTTKWMSYLAEGLLAEEEVQPSNPFFWCTSSQHPGVEQVDCRYVACDTFSKK
jgi:hypothetical protein